MNFEFQYIKRIYITLTIVIFFSGCKKFVTIDPPTTGLIGAVVYSKDATAAAAVNNIFFNTLSTGLTHGPGGITALTGLASDELKNYTNSNLIYEQFYKNAVSSTWESSFWISLYPRIYQCNEAIENLNQSTTITQGLKNQLIGESKFLRAFLYFYAVNLYGDVPLILTSDYKINSKLPRTESVKVWDQIKLDLIEAQSLLPKDYSTPLGVVYTANVERVLPIKVTATALLARVYLYREDWPNAVLQSTEVINDTKFVLMDDVSSVFKKNSNESIWQLGALTPTPPVPGSTTDGSFFNILTTPGVLNAYPVAMTQGLFDLFESADKRKTNWISSFTDNTGTYRFANKYKTSAAVGQSYTEYLTVLRIAEQYLIRSEANAQLNKITEAANDLNKIRLRAGLSLTTANDKNGILSAIGVENRKEFFCEFGHRWFDLKRTKTIDQVMTAVANTKGSTWKSEYQLLPIPRREILYNPNLTQNIGYQ